MELALDRIRVRVESGWRVKVRVRLIFKKLVLGFGLGLVIRD